MWLIIPSEVSISFRVVAQGNFTLEHVLNYPNPFTTHTTFWFEHNRPGEELRIPYRFYGYGKACKKPSEVQYFQRETVRVTWNGTGVMSMAVKSDVVCTFTVYGYKLLTVKAAEKLEKFVFIL